MRLFVEYFQLSPHAVEKILLSAGIILFLTIIRLILNRTIRRKSSDAKMIYQSRRIILYVYTFLLILLVGTIWLEGLSSISTVVGLASAGIAIALHDTIANMAGWFFILWRKPFRVGDRIQIGETAGDVIDIRFFQFSVIEIGNWIDADQSTGRIVHIPNSKVLRDPLANSHIGFEYIWNEIPVLITFESDWKKAKKLLHSIAAKTVTQLSDSAQKQISKANEKYFISFNALTPTVYTSVRDSGVLLTLRYLVNPRQRRTTEQDIWEAILDALAENRDVELAYPTTRFFQTKETPPG